MNHEQKSRVGTANPNSKLSLEAVQEIRRMASTPQPRGWQSELAKKLGVTPAAITLIIQGTRWTDDELKAVNSEMQLIANDKQGVVVETETQASEA